jgi:hypothetical protein
MHNCNENNRVKIVIVQCYKATSIDVENRIQTFPIIHVPLF